MATVSTHVLDTSIGRPAVGVRIRLESSTGASLGDGTTDADGRVSALGSGPLDGGDYRLRFDTAAYYDRLGVTGFYPEVVVAFTVTADEHYHVPLLLTPHSYSTYRGS
jgi:5-hydroxyisourate hydrolase